MTSSHCKTIIIPSFQLIGNYFNMFYSAIIAVMGDTIAHQVIKINCNTEIECSLIKLFVII